MKVLLDDSRARINHQHDHVGVLNRLQGFHYREFFDRLARFTALANARCIDKRVAFVAALERNINAIAGGSRLVVNDHSLFAKHTVNECRFAHVRASGYRDFDAGDRLVFEIKVVLRFFFFRNSSEFFEHT